MSGTATTTQGLRSKAVTRNDPFTRQVREKVESVLRGKKRPDELTGATSIRGAVGLILGDLEGITTLSEAQAWDYLDAANQNLVLSMKEHYRARVQKWRSAQPPL